MARWNALRRSGVPFGALLGLGWCGAVDVLDMGRCRFVRVLVVCI